MRGLLLIAAVSVGLSACDPPFTGRVRITSGHSVDEGEVFTLEAAPSDPFLMILWEQSAGPYVELGPPGYSAPSFTAPQVDADTELEFIAFACEYPDGECARARTTVTVVDVAP